MNNKKAHGAYSAFDKLLCPILAINDKYDVIFLNKTAEEVYKNNINRVNKSDADPQSTGNTAGKCYKISHGYDKPCFELGENCPLKELINNKYKDRAAVNHNHKGQIYKVEAYRDGEDCSLFLESHVNISEFISEIDIVKKAKEEIKESEELFRTLADNMQVGVDLHKEKFLYANPALQKMLGYTEDELKAMYHWDIWAGEDDYKNIARESIKKGLSDINRKRYYTFKAVKKTGEELWVYFYVGSVKYKGEIVRIASFIDITEMVNLRNSIEHERNLFKILIENIYSGIALYGKDKFLYVNSALLNLSGLTKEQFLSKSVTDFFDIDENQLYSSNVSLFRVHHNSEFSSRFIYKYKDKYTDKTDNVRYIDLFRTTVVYNGEETGLAIFTDVTDQIFREQNILVEKDIYKELSEIDALTQIYNRRAMDAKLTELLNLAKRYNRPLSIIMFDIDRFKNINDTFGHSTGDLILKELAAAAGEDLRNTDFFARYGGEEFIVIAPETPLKTAKELAERLRLKVGEHDFKIGRDVTISLGVASLRDGDDERGIVHRVDSALYKAKELGRNLVYSENFD
jgi:diguanylate cyclase (GGDEF)-like protein/PAS domain S-box-containing protein